MLGCQVLKTPPLWLTQSWAPDLNGVFNSVFSGILYLFQMANGLIPGCRSFFFLEFDFLVNKSVTYTLKAVPDPLLPALPLFLLEGKCAFIGWSLKYRLGYTHNCHWGVHCVLKGRDLFSCPSSHLPFATRAGWVNWALPDPLRQRVWDSSPHSLSLSRVLLLQWWKLPTSALSAMEATSCVRLLSTWNVANVTEDLNFQLYLILINLSLNLNNFM